MYLKVLHKYCLDQKETQEYNIIKLSYSGIIIQAYCPLSNTCSNHRISLVATSSSLPWKREKQV